MHRLTATALVGASLALAACGSANEPTAEETGTALDPGTTAADMSPTLEGSGDMSSAAGAGADTAAMDGGRAGADGTPPVGEGEGGPSDALTGAE